jgi:hypothetical protein
LNLHQVDEGILKIFYGTKDVQVILDWIEWHDDHDVHVCDCCGDGKSWYGVPGEHYNANDPPGPYGPYAYNGGLCECH